MKNGSYVGKITHGATQNIKAPLGQTPKAKGTVSVSGNDLRSGRSKKTSR